MKYCTNCVMPDTKPDLSFNEKGICNACSNYKDRSDIDWKQRERDFLNLIDRYRSKDGSTWDCVIPVSGGKDSTYQVIRLLQMGINPLCVTATTCDLSDIGRRNIENLKELGVDYIEFSPNKKIRRKLNRFGLTQVGDISWPEHVGIFTIPVRAAAEYKVPLIVWGENPQHEYGGPAAATKDNILNRRWLEEFGGLLGLRISDLIGVDGIEKKHLVPYTYPTDDQLQQVGVTGVFLGYYIPWDGYSNTLISQGHGFETYSKSVEGSMVNYENLDNYHTGIHDYFKYLKFGFGRATDLACMHLRRGRLTRQDAIDLIKTHDGKFPHSYLGKSLVDILRPLEMTVEEFTKICDRFTNKKIFKTDATNAFVKNANGDLIKLSSPQ